MNEIYFKQCEIMTNTLSTYIMITRKASWWFINGFLMNFTKLMQKFVQMK